VVVGKGKVAKQEEMKDDSCLSLLSYWNL